MMHFVKFAKRNGTLTLFNFFSKAHYSRRSDKNTSSYKIVKSNREPLDDVDSTVFGTNANWELLTPRGFRFYLPGSIGPGWLNSNTTSHIQTKLITVDKDEENGGYENKTLDAISLNQPMLRCVAQQCPMLLRKNIEELFPGTLDFTNIHLTIITISQQSSSKSSKSLRWSREVETEKLTKYFVLAASDICMKLKMIGYWADFINPFSGQPYLNSYKTNNLYQTDKRFRCLGFKIEQKNNCKVISTDSGQRNFVGSLYTTAPSSTEFLRDLLNDFNKD